MSLDLRKEGEALRKSIQPYMDTLIRSAARTLPSSDSKSPEVTVTFESGKHSVRINGVVIESYWREKAATTLADRIRVALAE